MRTTGNSSKSRVLRVTVSEQVADLLVQIAKTGLKGHNPAEVAHRFIDEAVMEALGNPLLELKRKKEKSR